VASELADASAMSRGRRRPAAAARRPPRAVAAPAQPHASISAKLARGVRVQAIDALRGAAICLMLIYHACFDLRYYRLIIADFEHGAFWLGFRALIVTSFLLLVGVSLVLAGEAGLSRRKFWRRVGIIFHVDPRLAHLRLGQATGGCRASLVGVSPTKGVATQTLELRAVDCRHEEVLSDVTGVSGILPKGMCVVQTPSPCAMVASR